MADTSSKATSMADLMAKHSTSIVSFKKGDTVKGKITKISKNEILVDLHAKGEALIIEKDPRLMRQLLNSISVGLDVEATVISPESESGQPIVSLRRFLDTKMWDIVEGLKKSQEQFNATVLEVTKGGYVLVSESGLNGFLPNSHVSFSSTQSLTNGKTVKVSVADYNKEDQKIIFSQKTTLPQEDFEKLTKILKSGDKVNGTISHIANFGLFITLHPFKDALEKTVDGLIHISEIAWERTEDIASLYTVGADIEASVIGFDRDSRRVDLSLKRMTVDPFEKRKVLYPLEKKVTGSVARVEDGNVFVVFSDETEGMIKKEKVPPATVYEVGQNITATVSGHDVRRRRLELTPVLLEKPLMYR